MPLGVLVGSLEAEPHGLLFQCRDGERIIECGISDSALHDLIGFHRIRRTKEPFRVLLPEIERLVNTKYDAGRFEENGWIVVRAADLLRYGFRRRTKTVA